MSVGATTSVRHNHSHLKTSDSKYFVTILNMLLRSTRNRLPGCKKVVPLRSIEAHLGDRRYSSYSFLTSALEGGEWSASRPGRALFPEKEPPVPIVQEAGWAPEPVWTQRLEEKSSASVVDRTPAVQSVVRHCTDWANRLPCSNTICDKIELYESMSQRFEGHVSRN
jgi:hypothetical protein